ncbi:MAG TPA: carbohydrate ABC transporter permease [Atribacter sp.]|uniref:carbohydrate ABC transporter permease n=1 Tax=Atribacter sp. TaxID=2847780 RepID=UPI002BD1B948|nr:carbohydrate ABC transporter permease [Atribacter sp.]HQK83457.1 carbohydrate ABC transporter permease [Atribacter sp.]
MRTRRGKIIVNIILWIIVAIVAVWMLFPFYWAVITSIKKPADVFRLSFIPGIQFDPTLDNWKSEFQLRGKEITRAMGNSLAIGIGAALIALGIGTLAGYGLARFRYHGWSNKSISMWILSQRFLPPAATVIPFFLIFKNLGLIDNVISLILVNATFTIPFAVLILRDAFKEVPEEIEESALVDGCSRFQAFFRMALPLAAPALVSAGIICFSFSWNEFLLAFIMTYAKASPMTVIIAGTQDTQGIQFWYVATRMLLAIVPPAVLALTVQKYIVRGLTFGAVKG